MIEKKEGDNRMKEEPKGDVLTQGIDLIDDMLEDPKMLTVENLEALRNKLVSHQDEMEGNLGEHYDEGGDEQMKDEKPTLTVTIGKMLGKEKPALLLMAIGMFFLAGNLFAGETYPYSRGYWNSVPKDSCVVYTTTGGAVIDENVQVSTFPAILKGITVNTNGTASFLEVFDSKMSTTAAGIQRIGTFDTTVSKSLILYDLYCSSGILINNRGTTPASITLYYRER